MFKRKSKSSVTTPSSMQQRLSASTTSGIRHDEIKLTPQQGSSSIPSAFSGALPPQMPPPTLSLSSSSASFLPSFGGRSQRQAPRLLLFRLVAFLSSPRVIAAAAFVVVVLLLLITSILFFSISDEAIGGGGGGGRREESSSAASNNRNRRRTSSVSTTNNGRRPYPSEEERIIPKPALPVPRFHVHFVAVGDDVTAGHYRPKLFGPLIESRPYYEGFPFSLKNRSRIDELLWRRMKNDKANEEREDGMDGEQSSEKRQRSSTHSSSPVYPLELAAAYARHVGRVDGSHHPPKLVSATLIASEDVRARQLASLASRVRAQKGYEVLKKREELGLDTDGSGGEGQGANIMMMPNSEVVRKLIRSELGPFFEHSDVELLARLYHNSVSSVLLLPPSSNKGSDNQKGRGGEEEEEGERIGKTQSSEEELLRPSLSPSSSVLHFYNALRNGSIFAPVDRLSMAAVTSLGATSALLYTQMHSDLMPYASSGPLYSEGEMRLPEGYFVQMENDRNSVMLGNSHTNDPDAPPAAVADAEHAGGEGSVFGLARLRRVNPLHGKQNAGVGANRHGGGVPIPEAPWLFNSPIEVEARRQAAIEAANRYRRKNPSSQVGGWHAVKSILSKLYAERVAEADEWPADHWLKMLVNADKHIRHDIDISANKLEGIEGGDGSGRSKVDRKKNAATKEIPPTKRHHSSAGSDQHDSSVGSPRGLRFHFPFKKNDTVVIMCGVMAGTFDALTASTNLEAARVGGGVVGGVFGEGGADANNVNDGNEHKYAQNPFIHAEMSVGDSLSTIARIHKQCMGYFHHRLSRWIEEDARLWQVKFAVPPRTLDDPRIAYHLRRKREEYAREREAKRLTALEEERSAQKMDGNKKKKGRDSLGVFHRVKSWLLRGSAAEDEKDDTSNNDFPSEDTEDDSNTYPAAATGKLLPLLGIKIKVVAVPMETTGLALDPNGEVMKAYVMPIVGETNLHPSPISSRAVSHCVHRDPSRGDAIDGDVWRFVQSLNDDLNRAIRKGALHTIIDAAIEDSGWRTDPEKTADRHDEDGVKSERNDNAQGNDKKNTKKKKKKMKAVTKEPGEDDFFDENPVDGEKKDDGETSDNHKRLTQKKRKRLALTALGTKVDFVVAPIPALGFQGLLNPPSSRSRMVNYASLPPLPRGSSSSLLPDSSLPSASSVLWLWSDCLRLSRHGYDGVSRIISNGAQRIVTAIAMQQLGDAL